ncbi:response regulator [Alteromonas sediminis]|uniref:Response regulator n=1 Tax=Alteromonas sediminis TaxID=2259342 RepID=A0A3N5XYF6_9ALTE|nr:response regulator [Alteromonas sediminis]RPJ65590.1 response regulator [Alteromonas sediminis]
MSTLQTLLIIEDDARLRELTANYLSQHGFGVIALEDGSNVSDTLINHNVDLIILDVMLPGDDGFVLCRTIRRTFDGPLLFLTAKTELADELLGFELGADDYITKPVEPSVLLARVQALLRRSSIKHSDNTSALVFGELTIDQQARRVLLGQEQVTLTSHEFDLLVLLAENAGAVVERDRIYNELIGREYDGLDRSADVRISRLRKKLKDNAQQPYRIKTIWGKGFFFVADAWS